MLLSKFKIFSLPYANTEEEKAKKSKMEKKKNKRNEKEFKKYAFKTPTPIPRPSRKLHTWHIPLRCILNLKKLHRPKPKSSRHQITRKRLHQNIKIPRRPIIIPPRQLNLILHIRKRLLQFNKILTRLQIRIIFRQRKQLPQRPCQLILIRRPLLHSP